MPHLATLPPRRHARRPRARRALLLAVASLTLSLGLATPTAARADESSYMQCVNLVGDWYDACSDRASTFIGEAGCLAAGTLGILACAAIEAARKVLDRNPLPAES